MIIKKFQAQTEKEATDKAKAELGENAIVMNVKTIKPSGLFKLFKKSTVEVTAAIDDNISENKPEAKGNKTSFDKLAREAEEKSEYKFGEAFASNRNTYSMLSAEDAKTSMEEKINTLARLLDEQKNSNSEVMKTVETKLADHEAKDTFDSKYDIKTSNFSAEKANDSDKKDRETETNKTGSSNEKLNDEKENKIVTLIKEKLAENEVSAKNINGIINELELDSPNQTLDNILSSVYQKIILKLGQVEELHGTDEKKPKVVFFVGNTGVGKTTTMAKLASRCILENDLKVAMLSVDTYRIAAIDQLKTYANILSAPMEVVYTPEEMKNYVEKYSDCDLILVDTAGRSHTNPNQKSDLAEIVDSVEGYEKEVYLVVSITTKYSDLMSIADTYAELFDFRIIFTKLDETNGLGNILNLKQDTGKSLSYVTWGQNVPEDLGLLNPQIIAKKLLGGAN